jgi:hypothetical protein
VSESAAPLPFAPLHARFLGLLPRIEQHGRIYFRGLKCPHRKEEALAEVRALAWQWFLRLARQGRDASAFVTALATYAARAVHSGRRLCGMERTRDVLSPVAQQRYRFAVEPLPASTATSHEALLGEVHGQRQQDAFEERLRDNTRTPVPDQAAFRIDFPAWLRTLTGRERRLIRAMARNERTLDLSREFEVSPGRISQLRRAFHDDWERFCADPGEMEPDAAV